MISDESQEGQRSPCHRFSELQKNATKGGLAVGRLAKRGPTIRSGRLATNHAGRKPLTAAARILDPKLLDGHAVDISVFRRAVESVEGDVRTWMNDVIHRPDPAQSR